MTEAVQPDPLRYGSFNEFFTRALKPDSARIARGAREIACPVDGVISEAGNIDGDLLLQAKGRHYSLDELLASRAWAKHFEGGSFATIYLAPFNYHRVHMPLDGRLRETVYVPGRLFSVNAVTASLVPRLFARNERVLTWFDTAFGEFALVLVGALNVGSIATVWAGDITPAPRRVVSTLPPQEVCARAGRGTRPLQHGLHGDSAISERPRALARGCASRHDGPTGRIAGLNCNELAADRGTPRLEAARKDAEVHACLFRATRRVGSGDPCFKRRRRERSADRIAGDPGRRTSGPPLPVSVP